MQEFPFKSILLHKIPDGKGWFIMGVKHNLVEETIAMLMPVVDQEMAQRWADQAAKNLAGTFTAELG